MTRAATRQEQLEIRLDSWKRERGTNKHGMAHLADRAIRLIEDELARLPVTTVHNADDQEGR